MTRKEAVIRYALENGELDGLKVWLLNGGDIKEYFVKNKKNIKITINEKQFSLSAKEAADIVKGMMPIEFSRQDFVNLYFKLSEEKQEELYNEVFPYYPQVIRTKKNPSSKEILDAVKRKHYIHFPDNFYDILSDEDLAECLLYDESMMHDVPESRWNSELAILFSKKLADKGAYYDRICIPEECQSAVYWENLCKADGYYYRILPEKYKDILSEELILFTLKNSKSYIGPCHLFETIPDELKTAKVSLLCCLIPENMKTDSFWEKVIDRNLFYKVSDLPEKYQKQAWTPEKCRSLSDIPSKLKDEDHVLAYLETRGHILPSDFEEFQTQKIIDHVMSREHNSNSKLWLLKYIEPEFRRRADMQEVLTNCKDAIFLKNLSQDEIRENINAFPKNILFAPDWYKDDIKIPEKYFEPGQQLTLFDFITE